MWYASCPRSWKRSLLARWSTYLRFCVEFMHGICKLASSYWYWRGDRLRLRGRSFDWSSFVVPLGFVSVCDLWRLLHRLMLRLHLLSVALRCAVWSSSLLRIVCSFFQGSVDDKSKRQWPHWFGVAQSSALIANGWFDSPFPGSTFHLMFGRRVSDNVTEKYAVVLYTVAWSFVSLFAPLHVRSICCTIVLSLDC